MKKRLFVYGTLQRGYGNNRLLEGQTFVGKAVTKKPYVLLNCGFPMAVPHAIDEIEALPVIGEVWEVDENALQRCDLLEGHPNFYCRSSIEVEVEGEILEDVNIYEMPQPRHFSSLSLCETHNNHYKWSRSP